MKEAVEQEDWVTDKPITEAKQDSFQRYAYAKRVAEIVLNQSRQESIVLGLYGRWGEGKTSVLNLIQATLLQSNNVAILNFNPWRFSSETELINYFFQEVAKVIDTKLYTKKESAVKAFKKYIAPFLRVINLKLGQDNQSGENFEASGSLGGLNESIYTDLLPDLEELRQRLEQLIIESGKRLVIFLDDVDRLEKSQIRLVFKMVKLIAEFKHTSYIIAFDDEMVANAIGGSFTSSGDPKEIIEAGRSYLEKIIQVPLYLPVIRPDDILSYCFKRLNETLERNDIVLSDKEASRCGNTIKAAFLPALISPRLAVRFANAVDFYLPLTKDEVNPVDAILIEGSKVFYPGVYEFIYLNEDLFVGGIHKNAPLRLTTGDIPDDVMRKYQDAIEPYPISLKYGIKNLLNELFPVYSYRTYSSDTYFFERKLSSDDELDQNKRIASRRYFYRYFSYSIDRNDVSDTIISGLFGLDHEQQVLTANDLIERIGTKLFLFKTSALLPSLNGEQVEQYLKTVCKISSRFKRENEIFSFSNGDLSSIATQAISLFAKLDSHPDIGSLILDIAKTMGTLEFWIELYYQINRNIRAYKQGREELLIKALDDQNKLTGLERIVVDRALKESDSTPLYSVYSEDAYTILFQFWPNVKGVGSLIQYLENHLVNREAVGCFLKACSPTTISSDQGAYKDYFSVESMEKIYDILGSFLCNLIQGFAKIEDSDTSFGRYRGEGEPSPENRIKQYAIFCRDKVSSGS